MGRIQPSASYRSQFDEDILLSATQVLVADTFQKVGEYTVLAGEAIQAGFGSLAGQHSAEGRVYVDLQDDAAADYDGVVRLEVHNARDRHQETLFESRTEVLRTSATDRTQQLPFPKIAGAIGQDAKLVLTFKPDDAGTLHQDNTNIAMDATIHDVRG